MKRYEGHEAESRRKTEPQLLLVVQDGRTAELKRMLSEGADVNIRSPNGNSAALHVAAINGYGGIASTLLKHGADKDALADGGQTPLMKAADLGHQRVAEVLLKAGANVNIVGNPVDNEYGRTFGGTALHFAASNGHHGIVKALLKHGADSEAKDVRGYTPLHVAVYVGRGNTVAVLLGWEEEALVNNKNHEAAIVLNHVDANAQDDRGCTPLHVAVDVGREDIVAILLESGAESLVLNEESETALVWAARQGKARMVEMMMENRAAFGESSTDGCLALYCATKHGHDGVVSALLQGTNTLQGANKDALDCGGERPLIWAVLEGHLRIVQALVATGVNINARRRSDGCTALHFAAGKGHDEIVSTLLQTGAYKDVLDNKGTTPLLWATAEGHLPTVKTLLAAGANFNIRGREGGISALHLAAGQGYHRIVSVLLRSGADADVVDSSGDTALMWAARNGHVRVVETLVAAGADVTIRNSVEAYSALDWATKGGHVGVQEAVRRRLAEAIASDEGRCNDMHLDSCADQVDSTQALNEEESSFDHPASARGEGVGADKHFDPSIDQLDAIQAQVDEEFNLGHQGQSEIVASASLTEGGGRSFRGVLAVPGWLDLEGVCLAVTLCLWFSCSVRCKLRG